MRLFQLRTTNEVNCTEQSTLPFTNGDAINIIYMFAFLNFLLTILDMLLMLNNSVFLNLHNWSVKATLKILCFIYLMYIYLLVLIVRNIMNDAIQYLLPVLFEKDIETYITKIVYLFFKSIIVCSQVCNVPCTIICIVCNLLPAIILLLIFMINDKYQLLCGKRKEPFFYMVVQDIETEFPDMEWWVLSSALASILKSFISYRRWCLYETINAIMIKVSRSKELHKSNLILNMKVISASIKPLKY